MISLAIDRDILRIAFEDDEFDDRYLDRETGNIIWVDPTGFLGCDKTEACDFDDSQPERYLRIPFFTHGDHHGLAQDFAMSEEVAPEYREYLENSQDGSFCVDVTQDGKAIMGGMGVFVQEAERLGYDYQAWEWKTIDRYMTDWLHERGIELVVPEALQIAVEQARAAIAKAEPGTRARASISLRKE